MIRLLYILYDGRCGLCRTCTEWLRDQPAHLELRFIPYQYEEGMKRFVGLNRFHVEQELHVITDQGGVYRGGAAWVMCLYALKEYREWSYRLAGPLMLPLAAKFCEMVSKRRLDISNLWFKDEPALRQALQGVGHAEEGVR